MHTLLMISRQIYIHLVRLRWVHAQICWWLNVTRCCSVCVRCTAKNTTKASWPLWLMTGPFPGMKKAQTCLTARAHTMHRETHQLLYIHCDLQRLWQAGLASAVASKPHHRPTNTYKQRQIVTPAALVQTNNKTQQLYTSVSPCWVPLGSVQGGNCVCVALLATSPPLSLLQTTPVVQPPCCLRRRPPTRLPTPTPQRCLIDRSNYVFYWPVARKAGRHFIVSWAKGKNGYCSLSGKDDGRNSRRKQMTRGESLPDSLSLTHTLIKCNLALKNSPILRRFTLLKTQTNTCTQQSPDNQPVALNNSQNKQCENDIMLSVNLLVWRAQALSSSDIPPHSLFNANHEPWLFYGCRNRMW